MAAASDDLTRPLGVDAARERTFLPRLPYRRIAVSSVVIVTLAAAGYAALFGDRWGGQSRLVVPVQTAEAPARTIPASSPAASTRPSAAPRDPGLDVEVTSGVSVLRPHGGGPQGTRVRLPDAATVALAAAPDPRLTEPGRQGALPRIGPDGSRPAEVYARPAGELATGAAPRARIAILVGGLGLNPAVTAEAIAKLPEPVTLSFAPYGADLAAAAARARAAGHEIMLQMPMEPLDYPTTDPGPQTLTTTAPPADNLERLRWGMSRFPGFVGISNFLGGKLTSDEAALAPILREIAGRGLIFVDDGSSSRSTAAGVAATLKVSAARADMVVDPVARAEVIDRALERLEATALDKGFALGSASALPLSIQRIARWADALEGKGILLVPVSAGMRGPGR